MMIQPDVKVASICGSRLPQLIPIGPKSVVKVAEQPFQSGNIFLHDYGSSLSSNTIKISVLVNISNL